MQKKITTKDAAVLFIIALEKFSYPKNYLDQLLDYLGLRLIEPKELVLESQIFDVIQELKNQKPVEYITGTATFYNNDFIVTPNVLIPRPDTEILVEGALNILKEINKPVTIIDIGTGSGAIIISMYEELKKNVTESDFWAIDISENALNIAKRNASQILGNNSIKWFCANVTPKEVPKTSEILIVTNPPYIKKEEMLELPDSVKNYEPHIALEESETFIPRLQEFINNLQNMNKRVHVAIEYNKYSKMIQRYSTPIEVSLQELLAK